MSVTIKREVGPFEVEMNWSTGDASVGIQDGWEECTVSMEIHPHVWMVVGFVPEYDKHPDEWMVDQVDITALKVGEHDPRFPKEIIVSVTDPLCWQPRGAPEKSARLGMLHGFANAVTESWNEMLADERTAEAELEAMLIEQQEATWENRDA